MSFRLNPGIYVFDNNESGGSPEESYFSWSEYSQYNLKVRCAYCQEQDRQLFYYLASIVAYLLDVDKLSFYTDQIYEAGEESETFPITIL